jgi:hypothetical protein
VVWNAWISDRSQKNSVVIPNLIEPIIRHHFASLLVEFTTPGEFVPTEFQLKLPSSRFKHSNAFRYHFFSDTVFRRSLRSDICYSWVNALSGGSEKFLELGKSRSGIFFWKEMPAIKRPLGVVDVLLTAVRFVRIT